jgi:hypothetical protein
MIMGILTFLTALTISGVAIYYSVAGLAAIFAAAVIPIIVMGVSLEVGKLVTAVWLHRNWSRAVWWMRTYLSIAVVVLMFITSMGIFGFLSKAHIEQTSMSTEQVALIDTLNDKESRSQAKIERWTGEMNRLMKGEDVRVDNLIEREQKELDKITALIKQEKDDIRVDFDKQIQLQNDRIEQARIRKEQDIAAAKDRFEGSFGGGAKYDEAVEKAKANELSVASSAQREIRNINAKLNDALSAVDTKYAPDIKVIQDRIQDLRNQANDKTEDIDGRITELEKFIDNEQEVIDGVREEKLVYEKTYRKLEAEVGPIKYIAEFIYGENADQNLLEAAVRWVIIIIIFVFDPLAVLLLIASQYTFNWYREDKGGRLPPKPDPDPEPEDPNPEDEEPPYTDEEWNEAHRLNDEFDRAKKIAQNVPPTLSKKKDDQYLLWPEIDPDNDNEKSLSEMLQEGFEYEKSLEENEDQLELDFDKEIEVPGDDLSKWNDWVEAANKAAEENPEDDEDYVEGLSEQEQAAITKWKAEDDRNSVKYQRKLHEQGKIQELPWMKYLKPQPDYVDDKFQIMPELEQELKTGKPQYTEIVEDPAKRTTQINWIEKEGKEQVKKTVEKEDSDYIQNEEQNDESLWNRVKDVKND